MSGGARGGTGQKATVTGHRSDATFDFEETEKIFEGWQEYLDKSDASHRYDRIASESGENHLIRDLEGRLKCGPRLMSALLLYFESDQWKYHLLEDHQTIVLAFQGRNGEWNCIAQVRAEQEQIVFYSAHEGNIAEDRRIAVAELVTRINFHLVLGAYEFDLEDGELNFRTALDCNGVLPEPRLVRNIIQTNLITMDRYLPVIRAVIGGAEPVRALAHLDAQD